MGHRQLIIDNFPFCLCQAGLADLNARLGCAMIVAAAGFEKAAGIGKGVKMGDDSGDGSGRRALVAAILAVGVAHLQAIEAGHGQPFDHAVNVGDTHIAARMGQDRPAAGDMGQRDGVKDTEAERAPHKNRIGRVAGEELAEDVVDVGKTLRIPS